MASKQHKKADPSRQRVTMPPKVPSRIQLLAIMGVLSILVLLVYWPVTGYGFVDLDDKDYFQENPVILQGLSADGVKWAFTTYTAANWHPLTWLSLMLDASLFGKSGFGPHLTNLLLHMANVLLVFALFRRMTGALWRSAFVAALFAIHPMHVESVAWVSERKDVLSMFFGLLALLCYVRSRPTPKVLDHVLVALFMALSLMAKPMFVTLPFLLLLLDYWPLGGMSQPGSPGLFNRRLLARRFMGKLPLLALACASSVITVIAQSAGGAVHRLENLTLLDRSQNVIVAYAAYLGKAILPANLCAYYPLPITGIPLGSLLTALAVLTILSWMMVRMSGSRPYLLTGWLWFLGALVPVIGIVQVGNQAMADRFAYLPFLGLYLIIVWGVSDLVRWRPAVRTPVLIASCATLIAFGVLASRQVRYWKDSVSLFGQALAVTTDNTLAEGNYGMAVGRLGRHDEAIDHLTKALKLWPDFFDGRYNLGVALAAKGRYKEAVAQYKAALTIKPGTTDVHLNLATAYARLGRFDEAIPYLDSVLSVQPENAEAHINMGMVHLYRQQLPQAIMHLEHAVRSNPKSAEALNNLGLALELSGRPAEAIARYEAALRLSPKYAQALRNLQRAKGATSTDIQAQPDPRSVR